MSPRFSSGGLSTFDLLGDLTPTERTLTRLLLRHSKMTEKALYGAILDLPEEKQMSKAEMQVALSSLTDKGWVEKKRTSFWQGFRKVYVVKQK